MVQGTGTARVRTARPGDISSLAELCRAAVGPDDYVLDYLREMLRDRVVIAAEDDGRIVAMAGVTECADRALWIGQMRTHPAYRRRGFARRLLDYAEARAVREGRPALRLWASHGNIASRTLFGRVGFREVAAFTRVTAPALAGGGRPLRADRRGQETWRSWRRSLYRRAGRGYVSYHWHFLPLTLRMMRIFAGRGETLVAGRAAVLAWTEEGDDTAYASVLAGGRDGLLAARAAAAMRGRPRVEVFLPRHGTVLAWAKATGFAPAAWGGHAVLYERRVRRSR